MSTLITATRSHTNTLIRWLKRFARVLLSLVALLVTLWTVSRLTPIPENRLLALQRLAPLSMPTGKNAYAAIVTLGYQIPDSERETVALDEEKYQTETLWTVLVNTNEQVRLNGLSPLRRYPVTVNRESEDQKIAHCTPNTMVECMVAIRANRPLYDAWTSRQAPLVEAAEALIQYDYLRQLEPKGNMGAYARVLALADHRMVYLVRHAQGRTEEALKGLCGQMRIAQKLFIGNPDNLMPSMIGSAILQGSTSAVAVILAEQPELQLPNTCSEMFAQSSAIDYSLCNSLRGELAMHGRMMRWMDNGSQLTAIEKFSAKLQYDAQKSAAMNAENMVHFCTAEHMSALAADHKSTPALSKKTSLWRFECLSNYVGCALAAVALPRYDDYQYRLQDTALQMKALRALLWLREQPKAAALLHASALEQLQTLIEQRPDELHSPKRAFQIVRGEDQQLYLRGKLYAEPRKSDAGPAVDYFQLTLTSPRASR